MKKDWLPTQLALLYTFGANFTNLLTATPAAYGTTAPIALEVQTAYDAFKAAYDISSSPETRTPAAVAATRQAETDFRAKIRPVGVNISRNPAVSDELKTGIGVTVQTGSRTPVPAPVTSPALSVLNVDGQSLNFEYRDATTPNTKAKPPGVTGLQLFASVGIAPAVDPDAAKLVSTLTKSPARFLIPVGSTGKIVTLFARWVTTGGPGGEAQPGPWSAPVTAVGQM